MPKKNDDLLLMRRMQEMERRYELLMPIEGEYDPSWCRDKFLEQLFAELDLNQPDADTETGSDSDRKIEFSIPNEDVSLSFILRFSSQLVIAERGLDRISTSNIDTRAFRLSVMTGCTDLRYEQLLESMQRSSLFFMFSRIINRLRIMESISLDWGGMNLNELPHKLFRWSIAGIFHRCRLPDDVYLDVLTRNHSADVLDRAKFSMDLVEILRYYKYFYKAIYDNNDHQKMMIILWDQQQLINIGEQLDANLKISIQALHKIGEQSRLITQRFWTQYKCNLVNKCKERSMEAMMRMPIEWRYIRNYYANLVDMQTQRYNLPVLKLKEQIQQLKDSIQTEGNARKSALAAYSMLAKNYHRRYLALSEKHSREWQYWEDQIVSVKFRLTKAIDNYKETAERIEFMRKRVGEVQELIAAERQPKADAETPKSARSETFYRGKRAKKSIEA